MNTNGMRVPVTARKQLTFNGTTMKAGRVFDALTTAKAKELYTAGEVVYGDASGDHTILIKEPPQPPAPVVSRPVVVPPQRTVQMVRTTDPAVPRVEVATAKSAEPVAPESAAASTEEPEFPEHTRPVVTLAESEAYDSPEAVAAATAALKSAEPVAPETAKEAPKEKETPKAAAPAAAVKRVPTKRK